MMELSKENCTGCFACQNICPQGCIGFGTDCEGFWYPQVDAQRCVACGLCERICPVLHHSHASFRIPPQGMYSAYSLDEKVREASSSGGVFTEIARRVLRSGGVVFGAALDEHLNVVHGYAETEAELSAFQGSKYVQSRIGSAYRQALRFLKDGRTVLFSGTPCQIAGLLSFLRQPYENLITLDIVCHGVPSPGVWRTYLKHLEKVEGSPVMAVSFRNKSTGWKQYSVGFQYADGTHKRIPAARDPYMRAFIKNLSLRPSCYQCKFKGVNRPGDLTLADFWGIEKICPEMDDDRGTSLVIVHSDKGRACLREIRNSLRCEAVESESIAVYNPSMVRPLAVPGNRSEFFDRIGQESFDAVVNALCPERSLVRRVLDKCRKLVKKNGSG